MHQALLFWKKWAIWEKEPKQLHYLWGVTFPQDSASPLGTLWFYALCCQWDLLPFLKGATESGNKKCGRAADEKLQGITLAFGEGFCGTKLIVLSQPQIVGKKKQPETLLARVSLIPQGLLLTLRTKMVFMVASAVQLFCCRWHIGKGSNLIRANPRWHFDLSTSDLHLSTWS